MRPHGCYTCYRCSQGGDAQLWSFQGLKDNATGDGGMITTNDKGLADKCRELTWFECLLHGSRNQVLNYVGTMK